MSWKNWVLNPELISILLGLGAMALPVVCMARRGKPGSWAAGSFFLAALAVTFQLFLLARFVEQDMATVEDTANARFLAAMVLLVCTAVPEPGRLSSGPAARAQIEKGLPAKTALFPVHERFSSTAATSWRVMKLWGRKLPSASPRIRPRARTDSTAAWAQGETGFCASSAK